MQITPRTRFLFRKNRTYSRPLWVFALLLVLLANLFVLRGWAAGKVEPLFMPTPTPTRTLNSYALEARTYFDAGDLQRSIEAYQFAAGLQPDDPALWYELARIQTYSSNMMTTDADRVARLAEALVSAEKAVSIAPDNSMAYAVRAFVLDWSASYMEDPTARQDALNNAEQSAIRALQLDNTNALALAYYAEILVDQQNWTQAEQYIRQALERDDTLMDVHRVNAYVLESTMYYEDAIAEYEHAVEINPALTFLYISIGANYRHLKQNDLALEYFAKAARINEQLGVQDPIPYLAIAKTYSQKGEFLSAVLNVRRAVDINPTSPDIYGQLGIVYFKARNYEGAIPALKCAVYGCDAAESCEVRQCDPEAGPQITIEGMPLTSNTLVYYYTYGSVLAGMHRPVNNYCAEAMKVLAQVRAAYGSDPTVIAIIEPSEAICAEYGY